jgi:Ca2+-binding EF-hand superfamily protein
MGNHHQHQLEEDLSIDDYRYLMKQTHLTSHVIQGWYREFLAVCPNGHLNKHQFIKFYKELENSSTKNVDAIAENVFQVFDQNGLFDIQLIFFISSILFLGNHRIDFKEFLVAYVLTSAGEPLDKLQYAFTLFDKDHSHTIEPDEMIELFKKLFTITGSKMKNYSPQSVAYDVFRALDHDHNQSLSQEEFINGCLKSESIRSLLSPFENNYPPQ